MTSTETKGAAIENCSNLVEENKIENTVKSTAIVRYQSICNNVPAKFLNLNTDLNMPPSNWLSNSADSYGLRHMISQSRGFSSFRMANMFPDCVGGVDVVSDAENIKRLLQLPYSQKSVVSMIVHRIENTILIDEFDIHKYLLRQSNADWQWLRSFIFENILNSLNNKDKIIQIKSKSREVLQHNNLTSKFLYYSIKSEKKDRFVPPPPIIEEDKDNINTYRPLTFAGPLLPEPKKEENLPDPKSDHIFNRNVVWTFEDIRMLIGTDMPIFGSPSRPCISLRLSDMKKPINILTGIDYWLDNLMTNVPEVMMCYHLDGLVQKYEIIKTEDLPNLKNSKFSPEVIKNVAQNILSFLKSNATKSGHTYWLFKGKNDDFVKLYDLTTLCKNNENKHNENEDSNNNNDTPESSTADENKDKSSSIKNPFTIPVAMLLYTVARNMKSSSEKLTAKKAGSIRTLLTNCIKLLPKEKHPQIVTSSHFILSDLYIPLSLIPSSPNVANCFNADTPTSSNSPNNNDDDDDILTNSKIKVAIQNIKDFNINKSKNNNNTTPKPLCGNLEMRCSSALYHIAEGLNCLQYLKDENDDLMSSIKQKIIHEEQNPNLAKSYQAIPLPYDSLKKDINVPNSDSNAKNTLNSKKKNKKDKKTNASVVSPSADIVIDSQASNTVVENVTTLSETPQQHKDNSFLLNSKVADISSWKTHLKILLFEKACLTYATLAENAYAVESYGKTLKYIYTSLQCQKIVTKYVSSISSQRCLLLGRAGDCLFKMSKSMDNINKYLKDFENPENLIIPDLIEYMKQELEEDTSDDDNNYETPTTHLLDIMLLSCHFYETALGCSTSGSNTEIIRRLGNIYNELGVLHMNYAQNMYYKEQFDVTVLCNKKSYDFLKKGIYFFKQTNDNINLALLLCNMGRYMRFRASLYKSDKATLEKFPFIEKTYYDQAFTCYENALTCLGNRRVNPEVWDMIKWEYSTSSYHLAKTYQDRIIYGAQVQFIDLEFNQVTLDSLQKALKLCDINNAGSRQREYIHRAALIHHLIAKFHSIEFSTNLGNAQRLKITLQLSRLHFEKAVTLLEPINEIFDYITVQVDRIDVSDFMAENATTIVLKQRSLFSAIDYFVQIKDALERQTNADLNIFIKANDDFLPLLNKFEDRMQSILRMLAKLSVTKSSNIGSTAVTSKQASAAAKNAELCKQMFGASLRINKNMNAIALANHLVETITKIHSLSLKIKYKAS